jgi:hypothetical protein
MAVMVLRDLAVASLARNPKEFYREGAKDAKLREAEQSCVILENLRVATRYCGISTKSAQGAPIGSTGSPSFLALLASFAVKNPG